MYQLSTTTQFRKDYKRIKKRHYDLSLLQLVLDTLLSGEPLPEKTMITHCREIIRVFASATSNPIGF